MVSYAKINFCLKYTFNVRSIGCVILFWTLPPFLVPKYPLNQKELTVYFIKLDNYSLNFSITLLFMSNGIWRQKIQWPIKSHDCSYISWIVWFDWSLTFINSQLWHGVRRQEWGLSSIYRNKLNSRSGRQSLDPKCLLDFRDQTF
jgi:hypothetical protein